MLFTSFISVKTPVVLHDVLLEEGELFLLLELGTIGDGALSGDGVWDPTGE